MTQKKITAIQKSIEVAFKNGYHLQALLMNYHLNLDIMRFMITNANKSYSFEDKKLKLITREFQYEIETNEHLKSVINKKSFKLVKTWLQKMDVFFKQLKLSNPGNTKALYNETEKIFLILNISINKLLVKKSIKSTSPNI